MIALHETRNADAATIDFEEIAIASMEGKDFAAIAASQGITEAELIDRIQDVSTARLLTSEITKLERAGVPQRLQAQLALSDMLALVSCRLKAGSDLTTTEVTKLGDILVKVLALLDRRDGADTGAAGAASQVPTITITLLPPSPTRNMGRVVEVQP